MVKDKDDNRKTGQKYKICFALDQLASVILKPLFWIKIEQS